MNVETVWSRMRTDQQKSQNQSQRQNPPSHINSIPTASILEKDRLTDWMAMWIARTVLI